MRTSFLKYCVVNMLAILLAISVSNASAQTPRPEPFPGANQPQVDRSNETLAERARRLQAEKDAEKKVSESAEEARVLELTENIRQERLEKEAKARISAGDDRDMREARKRVEKDAKNERERLEVLRKARIDADISGCEDPDSVWLHSYAVRQSRHASQVALRVMNNKKVEIRTIETSYKGIGVAVRNLCVGGSLTLSFIMEPAETYNNRSGINFMLTARGVDEYGNSFAITQNIYLRAPNMYYGGYYGGREYQQDYLTWDIR